MEKRNIILVLGLMYLALLITIEFNSVQNGGSDQNFVGRAIAETRFDSYSDKNNPWSFVKNEAKISYSYSLNNSDIEIISSATRYIAEGTNVFSDSPSKTSITGFSGEIIYYADNTATLNGTVEKYSSNTTRFLYPPESIYLVFTDAVLGAFPKNAS